MTYNWSTVRKAFFIGLPLTVLGVLLALYVGWNEATLLCLVIGPFLLLCSLVLAWFYRWMAHTGASRLPQDWEHFSPEAKRDFISKRLREKRSEDNDK